MQYSLNLSVLIPFLVIVTKYLAEAIYMIKDSFGLMDMGISVHHEGMAAGSLHLLLLTR